MAFKQNNLTVIGGNYKTGVVPSVYTYWNEDADVVTAADFVADYAVRVGDQVQVIANDYTAIVFYYVSAVTAGKATLVASTTPL